jgi:hypothetical protein
VGEVGEGEDGTVEPDFEALLGVRGLYLGMDQTKVDRMLDEHCGAGQPIAEWAQTYD